jgi:hypothetical protein
MLFNKEWTIEDPTDKIGEAAGHEGSQEPHLGDEGHGGSGGTDNGGHQPEVPQEGDSFTEVDADAKRLNDGNEDARSK